MIANSTATSTTQVIVNEAPTVVAGPDRSAAVGELLAFDGAGSADRDGKLVHFDWDFGNGAKGAGSKVRTPTTGREPTRSR